MERGEFSKIREGGNDNFIKSKYLFQKKRPELEKSQAVFIAVI